jgi:rhamnose transport system permease protein
MSADRSSPQTEPETPVGAAPAVWRSRLTPKQLMRWETGLAIVVVAIGVLGLSTSSQFLTGSNMLNLGLQSGEIAIMALPMTLIIISGEIDLSVASIMGMSSALLGYLFGQGWPLLAIFAFLLVVGVVAGAINGLLVTRVGLPSLAVTIGTLGLYRGVAFIVLGPHTIANFPAAYTNIGIFGVFNTNLSFSAAVFIVLAVIFGVVLHFTPVGRSIYAMGASPEAAIFAGIRVKRVKTMLFIVSGVVCAMAGALMTFRLSTAVNTNGIGLELDVVAIVLLGGVSIFGGKGTIVGVVLGVLAFAGISNALLLTNFNPEASSIPIGGLLLVSVFVPQLAGISRRFRDTVARRRRSAPALGASHE